MSNCHMWSHFGKDLKSLSIDQLHDSLSWAKAVISPACPSQGQTRFPIYTQGNHYVFLFRENILHVLCRLILALSIFTQRSKAVVLFTICAPPQSLVFSFPLTLSTSSCYLQCNACPRAESGTWKGSILKGYRNVWDPLITNKGSHSKLWRT